jgi:bacterial/archaeal transporter family-2 protein
VSGGNAIAVVLSIAAGLAVAVQVAVNGQLGTRTGTLEAFAFSVTITLGIALVILLVGRRGLGNYAGVFHEPWWLWLGGVMGAIAVFAIVYAGPRIGTFATIGLIIAGQLAMGALIDRFGLFGLDRIPLHWPRVVGIALLAAGATLSLRK